MYIYRYIYVLPELPLTAAPLCLVKRLIHRTKSVENVISARAFGLLCVQSNKHISTDLYIYIWVSPYKKPQMAPFSCSGNVAINLPRQTFTNHKKTVQTEGEARQIERLCWVLAIKSISHKKPIIWLVLSQQLESALRLISRRKALYSHTSMQTTKMQRKSTWPKGKKAASLTAKASRKQAENVPRPTATLSFNIWQTY